MQPPAFDPTKLYCICQQPESDFMIECAVCEKWFHTACFNLTSEDNIDADDFVFTCPDCDRGPNKSKEKPEKAATLNSERGKAEVEQIYEMNEEEPDLMATEKLNLSKRPTSVYNKQSHLTGELRNRSFLERTDDILEANE